VQCIKPVDIAPGGFEGHVEAGDHAAENVDCQRDPRPADRSAGDIIDEDDVHFRVIDLDHTERGLRDRKTAFKWGIGSGRFNSNTTLSLDFFRYVSDSASDRVRMRRFDTGRTTADDDFGGDVLNGRSLASEVDLLDNGGDDLLNFGREMFLSQPHSGRLG